MENISGIENSPRRSALKSSGLTEDDFSRPLVGIIYSENETVPCRQNIGKLIECIREGVISGGGIPSVSSAACICGGCFSGNSAKYALPSREITADTIEMLADNAGYDAVVFVGNSPAFVSGMLIASARINLPAVFVSGGCIPAGFAGGKKAGFSAVLEGIYGVKSGKLSAQDLSEIENSCPCGSEITDVSLSCVIEALGLSLPGASACLAGSAESLRIARQSGAAAVRAYSSQITPRRIIDAAALNNAAAFIAAAGACAENIMHLSALAYELKLNPEKNFNYDTLKKVFDTVPLLIKIAPFSDCFMEDFGREGGVYAVLKRLKDAKILSESVLTVTGKTIGENCGTYSLKDGGVIASFDKPLSKSGGYCLLYGNIAEEGCFAARLSEIGKPQAFSGPAKVFDSEEDALCALSSGNIAVGDVIVVRFEGVKSGNGMRNLSKITCAISGAGLSGSVALVTDGRAEGKGITASQVCPEAALQGNIAFIENGDKIEIDIAKGKINMDVPAKNLAVRKKKFRSKQFTPGGYLSLFTENTTDAKHGAVFKNRI